MNFKKIVFVQLCFLMIVLLCSCNGRQKTSTLDSTVVEKNDLDLSALVGKEPVTLSEYVEFMGAQQYSDLAAIYTTPPDEFSADYFIKLSLGNEIINLADNVTDFSQEGHSLAIGFNDGIIKIYSSFGCTGVQTKATPVKRISWFPESKYLIATSGDEERAEVFDLQGCGLVRDVKFKSSVDKFAVSPKGTWVAFIDQTRVLHVGSPLGKLTPVHRFLYKPLTLSFSSGEGIVMALDYTGVLRMWSSLSGDKIFEGKIKGAPFKSAKVNGSIFEIVTDKGEKFSYDIAKRARVANSPAISGFELKNSVLYYHSPNKRFSRKVYFKPVNFRVDVSKSAGVFRVNDIDGELRYYLADSGDPVEGVQDFADWQPIQVDKDYSFSYNSKKYSLAVDIAQREFQRLYCRYVKGEGYFLWWSKRSRPDDYYNSRGMLPKREGISEFTPIKWIPFIGGKADIRDSY